MASDYGDPGTHITDGLAHQQHLTLAGTVQTGCKRFLPLDSSHLTLPNSPGKLVPSPKVKKA